MPMKKKKEQMPVKSDLILYQTERRAKPVLISK